MTFLNTGCDLDSFVQVTTGVFHIKALFAAFRYWIILKKEDRKSKRSVGQIGRQAIIMRMRAERVIKAVDILKNGKF